MLQFILTTTFLVAVGAILILVVRTLPRVGEESVSQKNFVERFMTSEMPEKLDAAFNNYLFKFLRKLHVWVLKFDNTVHKKIATIKVKKEEGTNGKGSILNPVRDRDLPEQTEVQPTPFSQNHELHTESESSNEFLKK